MNMYIQIAALSINMKYVQDVLYENISPVYKQNAAWKIAEKKKKKIPKQYIMILQNKYIGN